MRNLTCSLLMMFAGVGIASGQAVQSRADVHLAAGIPVGAFADAIDEEGIGAAFLFGGRVPGLPLALGTEIGYLDFGSDDVLAVQSVLVPAGLLEAKTRRHTLMVHLVGRLGPQTGVVRPYLDVLAGVRRFASNTRIVRDIVFDERVGTATADFSDLTLSAGAGAGIDFQVFSGPMGWDERQARISLSLGARYLFGSAMRTLEPGSLRIRDGVVDYATLRTRTDVFVPHLGFRVSL